MKSKRRHEGYLRLDNRAGPGITEDLAYSAGLPPFAGRGLFEAPTYTCSHCQTVVVLNPLRNRERAYCSGCDHYICDGCGAVRAKTGLCKTFNQLIEEVQEQAVTAQQSGSIILTS